MKRTLSKIIQGVPRVATAARNEAPVPVSEQPAGPSFTEFFWTSEGHSLRLLLTSPRAAH